MKLRNKILAMAVVAVAGVNVYLANDVNARNCALSLLNLDNIAEASECVVVTEHILLRSDGTPVRVTYTICDGSDDVTCNVGGSIGTGGEYKIGPFSEPFTCTGVKKIINS